MSLPPIAILAGGLATRLQSLTLDVPKAMAPVAGRPFCAWHLEQLHRQGFREIVYLIGAKGDQLRDYVGDGERFGLKVSYVDDGPILLGTGGSVRQVLDLPDRHERFFVTYGDTFLTYDPAGVVETLDRMKTSAVMTVLRNEGRWDTSNIVVNHGMVQRYEKNAADCAGMHWIDYGAMLLHRRALEDRPAGEAFDLSAQLGALVEAQEVAAYEVTERFYEIGTPQALAEADAHFRSLPTDPAS